MDNLRSHSRDLLLFSFVLSLTLVPGVGQYSYIYQRDPDAGTLAGDVQNWAMLIQNFILQVCLFFKVYNW